MIKGSIFARARRIYSAFDCSANSATSVWLQLFWQYIFRFPLSNFTMRNSYKISIIVHFRFVLFLYVHSFIYSTFYSSIWFDFSCYIFYLLSHSRSNSGPLYQCPCIFASTYCLIQRASPHLPSSEKTNILMYRLKKNTSYLQHKG